MTYYFHPDAEAEHYETIQYYEAAKKTLGRDYLQDFELLMLEILKMPQRFGIERKPDFRRAA